MQLMNHHGQLHASQLRMQSALARHQVHLLQVAQQQAVDVRLMVIPGALRLLAIKAIPATLTALKQNLRAKYCNITGNM